MKRILMMFALCAGLLAVSGSASAQSVLHVPQEHDHLEIEAHGFFPYGYFGYGFGGGARVGIPLLKDGIIHSINNSLNLSVGGDFFYDPIWGGIFGLWAHVDAQWNVYLTEKFSAFAEVGFAPLFIFGCSAAYNSYCGSVIGSPAEWFDVSVGGRYHFGGQNGFPALTVRVGYTGVTAGLSF